MHARLTRNLLTVLARAMADAAAAPVAPAQANPDLDALAAPDADLAARAAALVAALRSGDRYAQAIAAMDVADLAERSGAEPASARSVAALVTAGVAPALVQLLCAHKVIGESTDALGQLMAASVTARRAVVDDLGFDALMQLLLESKDKEHLPQVAYLLYAFSLCDEWKATLSPDSDVCSRILALPFIKTASARVASCLLSLVRRLVKQHPSLRHAVTPSHLSLLAELLAPRIGDAGAPELAESACRLVECLQKHGDFDFEDFDEAGGYASCVELHRYLYRLLVSKRVQWRVLSQATRVVSTAYHRCPELRSRFQHLLLSCPGALASVVVGVHSAVVRNGNGIDKRALCGFLDALRRDFRYPEAFLFDTHFAACCIVYDQTTEHPTYRALVENFKSDWRTTGGLRALARPLEHQRLAAAVTLSSICGAGVEFARILAAGDRLEVLVAALVELALDRFEESPLSNSRDSQMFAVVHAICRLVDKAVLLHTNAAAGIGADEMPAKRQRVHSGGAMLLASDVNVQRRDSTVLLITGRPFYVIGALLETKSAVLADALSSATTLDPVAIALPNEVHEEQQYGLFHIAVEHAYTGAISSDVAAESLLPLWCLGDHLQMDELCAWCVERMAPVLKRDAALLDRTWATALARPSDALGDACATAWLVMQSSGSSWDDHSTWLELFKRVHDGCAVKELPAAQLVRVLRKALLADIAKDEAAAAEGQA